MDFDFNKAFEAMMEENGLDTAVVLGHINPDGDAAGSVMGVAHYLHCTYPQYRILPYLAENVDRGPMKQLAQEKVFKPFRMPEFSRGQRYGAVVCDTATKARMEGLALYEGAAGSVVIDHHAGNEGYGDYRHCWNAEACAQVLWGILDGNCLRRAGQEPYPNAADYLYMGILHDTERFSRATREVLQAASGLIDCGADHRKVILTMQTQTVHELVQQAKLMQLLKREMEGKVAYIFLSYEDSQRLGLAYEDIHPVSGILRDCQDVELGFTVFEETPGFARCSFRSDGRWINVNELLAPFGGGGHAGAAGLKKKSEDLPGLLQEILGAVREKRESLEGRGAPV